MTNEQILKKAISKAVKNGWNYKPYWHLGITGLAWGDIARNESQHIHIIFSHDFAKAFLNIKLNPLHRSPTHHGRYACVVCREENERWKKFLQQMVISRDPIKYLERFLK